MPNTKNPNAALQAATQKRNVKTSAGKSKRFSLVRPEGERAEQEYYNVNLQDMPKGYRADSLGVCFIRGDSLANSNIPRGYVVSVARGYPVKSGDLAAIRLLNEDSWLVRYLFFGPGGAIRLQSADREVYEDLIYIQGEFEIIGPVIHAEAPRPQLRAELGGSA